MLAALFQAVLRPDLFYLNPRGRLLIDRHGWTLIAVRWLYWSAVFSLLRDYHGNWKPFVAPPFGLSLDSYAALQRRFSVLFGFALMAAIAGSLAVYLRLAGKAVSATKVLNVLGVTFFFPSVVALFFDLILVARGRWKVAILAPLHTLLLIWEAAATMAVLDKIYQIELRHRIADIALIMGAWIAAAVSLWR